MIKSFQNNYNKVVFHIREHGKYSVSPTNAPQYSLENMMYDETASVASGDYSILEHCIVKTFRNVINGCIFTLKEEGQYVCSTIASKCCEVSYIMQEEELLHGEVSVQSGDFIIVDFV
jgi:hypothetical protein